MPRTARCIIADHCYHVLNRGNRRATLFHEPADYEQFLLLVRKAQERLELPVLAACMMPNHIHLVVRPNHAADLASWTRWLFTTHVRWHHAKYATTGHLWQGRYKAFVCQGDHHLLTVMRYVERNALRAKLVESAEDWRWGSLAWRRSPRPALALTESPVPLPSYWRQLVNEPQTATELAEIRRCVNRQRPFGDEHWVSERVREMGLENTLAPNGRPRRSRSVPVC
jgi:putative transposase